ncbi:MAG: hypothetical protein M1820_004509 [Bogoriella megaspora]|nr:MAG: hypothetical protein M1820_004509 [Bogoriella megaspora]
MPLCSRIKAAIISLAAAVMKRCGPLRAEPSRDEPFRDEPSRAEPFRAEPFEALVEIDPYFGASRHSVIWVRRDMTLKELQHELLDLYNSLYPTCRGGSHLPYRLHHLEARMFDSRGERLEKITAANIKETLTELENWKGTDLDKIIAMFMPDIEERSTPASAPRM